MKFLSFSTDGFRNLVSSELLFHHRFNLFFGENGQGKTNLLEGLYLLCALRSFRTNSLEETLPLGHSSSYIHAQIESRQIEHSVSLELLKEKTFKKIAKLDGKSKRISDYFGKIFAITFVPEDLRLPKGSPSVRRKFLDRAIWNTYPSYLKEVQTYERILQQRNALLKLQDSDMLPIYNEQLATAGVVLIKRRLHYLQEIRPLVTSVFQEIVGMKDHVALYYRSNVFDTVPENLQELLQEKLQINQSKDLFRGYTQFGPHADDIDFLWNEQLAQSYASQGQVRAIILATKIAEILYLREKLGMAPVLLLDDVTSELDERKNQQLFSFLQEIPCQIFLTTTNPSFVPILGERKDFHVKEGKITACL